MVIHIPELIKKLTEENTETSKNILKHIVEVVHLLMQFHSGFPELYDPIFQAIEVRISLANFIVDSHVVVFKT